MLAKTRSTPSKSAKTAINPVTKRKSLRATAPTKLNDDSDDLSEESGESEPTTKANKKRKVSSINAKSTPKKKTKLDDDEDEYEDDEEASPKAAKVYNSDALDDDSEPEIKPKKGGKVKASRGNKSQASPRKYKKKTSEESEAEYGDLAEGQEVVGIVVKAPTTGRVPPGRISQNTLDFLAHLKDPACNDREWFKLHEPVYRLAEKEWKDFVEAFTDNLSEVDPQIPHLPPKDVVHRIYRDIRFSNDKTPYKRGFSASFSRSGRKGIFAHYHISVKPGDESIIAGGSWCPARSELANIRANIQRNPRRLRRVISAPQFVKYFGKPEPNPNGGHQNIFGMDDELKTAPKGMDKDHKDIDLLKCRSFAVVHRFLDSEVLSPNFRERLAEVAAVMTPFVHCLNDMMTVLDNDDDDEEEEGDDDDDEDNS